MQAIHEQKPLRRNGPAEPVGLFGLFGKEPGRRFGAGFLGRLAEAMLAVASQNVRTQRGDAAPAAGSPARQGQGQGKGKGKGHRPRNLCEFDYDYYVNLRATHRQPPMRQRRMETSCCAPA